MVLGLDLAVAPSQPSASQASMPGASPRTSGACRPGWRRAPARSRAATDASTPYATSWAAPWSGSGSVWDALRSVSARPNVPEFSGLRVAVAGDLICDHYVVAEPRGLSREAPVMVLRHRSESVGAGGAANVARNLRALGATTLCAGALGRDARGREVIERLESEGVDVSAVRTEPGWSTPTKTRVLAA